jgi:hypothetical protein
MTSSILALTQLLWTFPPSSIRVSPDLSGNSFLWEFSFPSALHVTVELSPSQSQTMADTVASISARQTMPLIGFGWQQELFGETD